MENRGWRGEEKKADRRHFFEAFHHSIRVQKERTSILEIFMSTAREVQP